MVNSKAVQFGTILMIGIIILSLAFLAVLPVLASDDKKDDKKDKIISLEDPLAPVKTDTSDDANKNIQPVDIVNRIAKALIYPIGAVAFIFMIIGGFYWIFSGGNDEKIKKGKDIILWTIVGLLIVFSSYAILSFVFAALIPPAK